MPQLYKNILSLLIFFFIFCASIQAMEVTKDLKLDIELWSKLYANEDYVSDDHILDDLSLDLRVNFLVYHIDTFFVQVSFSSLKTSQVWNKDSSILYYDGFFQKAFVGYEGEGYKVTAGLQDSLASEDFLINDILKLKYVGLKSNFFLLLDQDVATLGFVNPHISGREFSVSYRQYLFQKNVVMGASFIPRVSETKNRYDYKESALDAAISYNNTNGVWPFAFMLSTRYYLNGVKDFKRFATSISTRLLIQDIDLRISYLREFYMNTGKKHYEGLMYSFMYPLGRGVASFKFFNSFIQESAARDKSFFYQLGYSYAVSKYIFLEALLYASSLNYTPSENVLKEKGLMFGLKYQYG